MNGLQFFFQILRLLRQFPELPFSFLTLVHVSKDERIEMSALRSGSRHSRFSGKGMAVVSDEPETGWNPNLLRTTLEIVELFQYVQKNRKALRRKTIFERLAQQLFLRDVEEIGRGLIGDRDAEILIEFDDSVHSTTDQSI